MEQHKVARAIASIKPVAIEAHLCRHQQALAEATDTGAVAGRSLVEPRDVAGSAITIDRLAPATVSKPKLAGCALTTTQLADARVINVDGGAAWYGFHAGKDFG